MKLPALSSDAQARLKLMAAVVAAFLIGPAGWSLVMAFQTAPLPQFYHLVAFLIFGLIQPAPIVWIVLVIASFILAAQRWRSLERRAEALFWMAIALAALVSLHVGISLRNLRAPGLARASRQAAPLIAAINSYNAKSGDYPSKLEQLVPEFLPAIPSTGMVGYPTFQYSTARPESRFKTWELKVATPVGGINFDSFNYWPEGGYPAEMYGGRVEQINGWAYVHE